MSMSELKQRLMIQELSKIGLRDAFYKPESDAVQIKHDENRPTVIYDDGSILYGAEHRDFIMDTLGILVKRVNEVTAAWENSQAAPFDGVSNFRLIAEYNNIVLCARDDSHKGYGLHFVTWECNREHTAVAHGHYTQDYDWVKQDFAVRAGLFPEAKVFTPEQAAEIKAAVDYRIDNDGDISLKSEKMLKEISDKLSEAYPENDMSAEQAASDKNHSAYSKTEKSSLLAQLEEKSKEVKPSSTQKKDGIKL